MRLEAAFDHHLQQEECADCVAVNIYLEPGDRADPRYQYRDRAHCLSALSQCERNTVRAVVSELGLEVLAEGQRFISVERMKPDTAGDVTVSATLLNQVFSTSLDVVVGVEEVVDRETRRTWINSARGY